MQINEVFNQEIKNIGLKEINLSTNNFTNIGAQFLAEQIKQ